uniref:IBB domain-containing protein n=1 Tax=Vitis vinifera TaxID=29760 RepID=A5B477_VITVI|nr:hypothetical protein VITISV_025742 [Vitis vinifera]
MSLRPSARTEVRRNRYKVSVDAEEGRRRREDNMVEIRKNRREESLQKKRREGLQAQTLPASIHSAAVEKKLEFLPSMVAGVWTDDSNIQLEATTQFRKLLSIERCPPIEEVIQSGVVPRFVEFLVREDFPQLQFEAAWALTNIASGTSDNTKVVIDHGAVPVFVKLLGSPSDDVRCVGPRKCCRLIPPECRGSCPWPWGSASFAGTVERTCKAVYAQECYLDTFKFLVLWKGNINKRVFFPLFWGLSGVCVVGLS